MNNNYFPNGNSYPTQSGYPNQQYAPTSGNTEFPSEQSYIENILRLNKGKLAKFYCTFPDSTDWRDSIFNGIIEQAGRDHLIISNPTTGKWYVILMIYLNYVEFEEKVDYSPDFYINGL